MPDAMWRRLTFTSSGDDMKRTAKPANDDMAQGYMDGRDLNSPEPSGNRSHSYRHGFMVGRSEKLGRKAGSYEALVRAADVAMETDAGLSV
jgi:hypothetical protein